MDQARTAPSGPSQATGAGQHSAGRGAELAASLGLAAMLGVVVWLRSVAIHAGAGDPILNGLAFGAALLVLAASVRMRPAAIDKAPAWRRPFAVHALGRPVAMGLAGGGALVALAVIGQILSGAPSLPAVFRAEAFAPWVLATLIVAAGEEAVLRGVLFDRLGRSMGLWPAIVATSLVFALIHVPFYGWRVVPLDVGVGFWLAGLRLASGGILAPSIAHALADLATWWL